MVHTPEFQDKTNDKTTNDLLKAFDLETSTPASKSDVEKVGKLLKESLDGSDASLSHKNTELFTANKKAAHRFEGLVSKDNPQSKEVYEKAPSPKMLYVDKAIPGHESIQLPKEQYEGKPQNLEGIKPKVEQTEKPSDKANEKYEKIADNVKTNDKGQITEIAYPDGTSRHFEYGQDGKMSGYTAPEGSHWTTKDGVKWTKDGGKDQLYGVFNVDKKTGEFTFLNALEGHATVCKADGKREEKGDLVPAISKFICEHKDSIDILHNEFLNKDKVDGLINNPKASTEETVAAAFLRTAMKEKNQASFAGSPEALAQDLAGLDRNTVIERFKHIVQGAGLAQGFEKAPIFPTDNQDLAAIIKDAKPGYLGNDATLKPLKDLATKPGGLDKIRNMIKDKGDGKYEVKFPGDPENPITVDAPTLGETLLSSYGPPDSQQDQHPQFLAILEKAAGTYLNEHQSTGDQITHSMQHAMTEGRLDPKTIIPADALSYDPNGEAMSAMLGLTPNIEVARKTPPMKKQPTQISIDDSSIPKDQKTHIS